METAGERAARLAAVRRQAQRSRRGELERPGQTVVFGEGNPAARLMLIGEAPGEVEDRVGRPFVGPAGRLLDRALAAAGVDRAELWVTNVVKGRPTAGVGNALRNRAPRAAEVGADRPWLDAELAIVRPSVVACLGATAASAVIHPDFRIGQERGQWFPGPLGSAAIATYHPSYALRLTGPSFDRVFGLIVEDLARAYRRAIDGE